MKLHRDSPNNHGYIHPDYIAHLEPLIKSRRVGLAEDRWHEFPEADSMEFVKIGLLDELSTIEGTTSLSILIAKGEGHRLTDDPAGMGEQWLKGYYDEPERNPAALIDAFANEMHTRDKWNGWGHYDGGGERLRKLVTIFARICIQDLGFDDSQELSSFVLDFIPEDKRFRGIVRGQLQETYLNFLSPDDLPKAYEDNFLNNAEDHIRYARMWEKLGNTPLALKYFSMAEEMAGANFLLRSKISGSYLTLYNDLERFLSAQSRMIPESNDMESWMAFACMGADLARYIGTEEAIAEGRAYLHRAERLAIEVGRFRRHVYELLSYYWRDCFMDSEEVQRCGEMAKF